MDEVLHLLETVFETIVCWHLHGNHQKPGLLNGGALAGIGNHPQEGFEASKWVVSVWFRPKALKRLHMGTQRRLHSLLKHQTASLALIGVEWSGVGLICGGGITIYAIRTREFPSL